MGDHMANVQTLDFEKGLAGIGWSVEWIVQNKFMEADTEEILEDLDDELYKAVVYAGAKKLNLNNGALGTAMYFHQRLLAQNPDVNRFRKICNQECLIFLIDDLKDQLLTTEDGLIYKNELLTVEAYRGIAQCLIFLGRVEKLKLNTEITERLINAIVDFIYTSMDSQVLLGPPYREVNAYLAYAIYRAGVDTDRRDWQLYALNHFQNNDFTTVADHNFLSFIDHQLGISRNIQDEARANPGNTIFDFLFEIDREGEFHWQEAFGF
jgi:hypothetical protein